MNTPKDKQSKQSKDNESECLECSIFSQELEAQALQETDWESRRGVATIRELKGQIATKPLS
ncbi:MAG: hypothetical protein RLZZ381_3688 [Cyanobacteriota bacterium]|jgi:hypothetical protein